MNLLFLHGAGGNSNSWICQKRVFGGHYLELHEEGGKKTIEEYADFVKAYVDKRMLTGIVSVGHSMGGAIALIYALKYETERLVLAGTGSHLKAVPRILEALKKDCEAACRTILDCAFAPDRDENLFQASLGEMLSIPSSITLSDFEACDSYDVTERLSEIKVPTLILCGTEDRLAPPHYSRVLAKKIKGSRLHLIEGAGHMDMMERADEFNSVMKKFLE